MVSTLDAPTDDDNYAITDTQGRTITKKTTGQLKDFGSSPILWITSFQVYISLLHAIYGKIHPDVMPAATKFSTEILRLSRSYQWQTQVLPLPMAHHNIVLIKGVTVAEYWVLDQGKVAQFVRILPPKPTPDNKGSSPSKKKRIDRIHREQTKGENASISIAKTAVNDTTAFIHTAAQHAGMDLIEHRTTLRAD